MSRLNKVDKIKELKWLNIFIRNFLLVGVAIGLHIMTRFNSKVVFLISGMLVVWVSWQFHDYINYRKKLQWSSNGTE